MSRAISWIKDLGLGTLLSLIVLVFMVVAVLAPSVIAPGDPAAIDPSRAMLSPRWGTWFGTDESGRDVWTRVVHGAAPSLGVGLGPRFLDAGIARVIEVLYALPTMVLALLLVAIRGPGVAASVLAVGLATAPGYARILRARTRAVASSGYVSAARLEGHSGAWVLRRHIAGNSLWPLAAVVTLGVGQAVVWVAALSFLGLGALPPSPEWGAMLNAGRVYLSRAWWLTVSPGLAITVTAAALTVIGRRVGRRAP